MGIARARDGILLLGDRTQHRQNLDEIVPVYRRRRDYLRRMLDAHRAQPHAAVWGDERYRICGSCAWCEGAIDESRDLLQVAGLSRDQRSRLLAAGIGTIDALGESTAPPPGMSERTWARLRDQAAMQVGATDGAVRHELVDAGVLGLIPPPDAGDIFFDFEGDPLWTDSEGIASGLEYLFGLVELDEPEGRFIPYWAHDRAEERQALVDFLDHVRERRAKHPQLHIYHYAPYEVTALKRLTARHSYGEDQLDELLRANVFIDLYAVVRRAIRVSQPSYSIKKLEPLYMGDELRSEDGVTTAGDSVVVYHQFQAARERGDAADAAALLDSIADYNRYDCISTWRLRDWLLSIRPAGTAGGDDIAAADAGASVKEKSEHRAALEAAADQLMAMVPAERADRSNAEQGIAMLAAALGFFQREEKPTWWAYFDKQVSPPDEWLDSRGTLHVTNAEVIEPWHKPKGAQTFRRRLRLTGSVDPGSSLKVGTKVCAVYESDGDGPTAPPGLRGLSDRCSISEMVFSDDDDGSATVEIEERTQTGEDPFDGLPMGVFEFDFLPSGPLEKAILARADQVLSAGSLPSAAWTDLLVRRPPRLVDGDFDASVAALELSPDALANAVRGLDDSYLAVQGPPGAGKTHVGSHTVAQLVAGGWRVGVVAQSHATVENFLTAAVRAGVPPEVIAQRKKPADPGRPWTTLPEPKDLPGWVADRPSGFLVGGTAWAFAAWPTEPLDLLVIDEAGQFSLAHTIAAAGAARRLLLLGDPQQLPQVSEGTHPEPVDSSALGWLAEGHDTLPPDRGFFLEKTWRMHSALTRPVSALAYDDRLSAQTAKTDSRQLDGIAPGVHPVTVEHRDNSIVSAEEAAEVTRLVDSLIGTRWKEEEGTAVRPIEPSDIIVVAPYNAQVGAIRRMLDDAGFTGTPVGTVDRFQGREAPVTIVSLAASSASDLPRGLDFLLDRRRLNVAISRAQWGTYIVHSPALADAMPTSVSALTQLGAFLRLVADR